MAKEPERPVTDNSAASSSNNNFPAEFAQRADYSPAESLPMRILRRSSRWPRSPGPARCSQAITGAGDTTPIPSAGDALPTAENCSTSWGLSEWLAQDDQFIPDCFPATSAWRRGRSTVWLGDRLCPVELRHGVQPASARLEPATATAMAGPISRVRRRLEGRRWEMQLKGGSAPTPYCRGADGPRRAALQPCAVFWLQGGSCTPLGVPRSRR